MNSKLMPGDRVIWHKIFKGSVSATKIEAEVFYTPTKNRVAIRFIDKAGDRVTRFVPLENLERMHDQAPARSDR
jgi:hypothetical protein